MSHSSCRRKWEQCRLDDSRLGGSTALAEQLRFTPDHIWSGHPCSEVSLLQDALVPQVTQRLLGYFTDVFSHLSQNQRACNDLGSLLSDNLSHPIVRLWTRWLSDNVCSNTASSHARIPKCGCMALSDSNSSCCLWIQANPSPHVS